MELVGSFDERMKNPLGVIAGRNACSLNLVCCKQCRFCGAERCDGNSSPVPYIYGFNIKKHTLRKSR